MTDLKVETRDPNGTHRRRCGIPRNAQEYFVCPSPATRFALFRSLLLGSQRPQGRLDH